jgi:hypothetical protein
MRRTLVIVLLALIASGGLMAGSASTARNQLPPFLWGAWIGKQYTGGEAPWNWQAVNAFEARNAGGKHINIVHWGAGTFWEHDFNYWLSPLNRVRRAGAFSLVDVITAGAPLTKVADGAYDSALRNWATQAKRWGHPFLLRFDQEMNGSWEPWGTTPANQNTPADFVTAWRHVHDIFTAAGATNVLWVWCPNAIPPRHNMTDPASLYPGTAYLDWTCLDGYNAGKPWTSFTKLFARSYHEITRLAPDKPMIIGEVASTGRGRSKARWIRGMFQALKTRFHSIHGLVWYDKWGLPNKSPRDWPIETSRAASAAFSAGIRRTLARTGP